MKQATRALCTLALVLCMSVGLLVPVVASATTGSQITVNDEVEVINSVKIGFDQAVISPGTTAAFPDNVRVSGEGFVPTDSEATIKYYQFPSSMTASNPRSGYGKHTISAFAGHDSAFVVSYDPNDPDYVLSEADRAQGLTAKPDMWGESDISVYPSAFLLSKGDGTFDYATVSFNLYLEGLSSNMVLRLESASKYRLLLLHPVYEDKDGKAVAKPFIEVYLRTVNTNAQDSIVSTDRKLCEVDFGVWNNFRLDFHLQSGTLGFYDYDVWVNGALKNTSVNESGETIEVHGHMEYFASLETLTSNTSLVSPSTQLRLYTGRPEERPTETLNWAVDDLTLETVRYSGEPDEITASLSQLRAVEEQKYVTDWASSDYSAGGIVNVRPQGIRINGSSAIVFDRLFTDTYTYDAESDLYRSGNYRGVTFAPTSFEEGTSLTWNGKTYTHNADDTYTCADSHYVFSYKMTDGRKTITVRSDISASDPAYQVKGAYPTDADGRAVSLSADGSVTVSGIAYGLIPLYKSNGNAYLAGSRVSERYMVAFSAKGAVSGVSVNGTFIPLSGLAADEWNSIIVEVDGTSATVSVNGAEVASATVAAAGEKPVFLLCFDGDAQCKDLSLSEYLTTTTWYDENGRTVDAARAAYIRYCQAQTKLEEAFPIVISDGKLTVDGGDLLPADIYAASVSAEGDRITLGGVAYTKTEADSALYKASDGTTLHIDEATRTMTRTYLGGVTVEYTYLWDENKTALVLYSRGSEVSLAQNTVGLTVGELFYQNTTENVFALYDSMIKVNGTVYQSNIQQFTFALEDGKVTMDGKAYLPNNEYSFTLNDNFIKIGSDAYNAVNPQTGAEKPLGEYKNNSKGATMVFEEDGTTVSWIQKNPNATGDHDRTVTYKYTYTLNASKNRITFMPKDATVPQDNYKSADGATLAFSLDGTVKWKKAGGKTVSYAYAITDGTITLSLKNVKVPIGTYTAENGDKFVFPEDTTNKLITFQSGGKTLKYRYMLNAAVSRLTLIDQTAGSTGAATPLDPDGVYYTADGKNTVAFNNDDGTVTFTSGGKTFVHRFSLAVNAADNSRGTVTVLPGHSIAAGTRPTGAFLNAEGNVAMVFDGTDFNWHTNGHTWAYTYEIDENLKTLTLLPRSIAFEKRDNSLVLGGSEYAGISSDTESRVYVYDRTDGETGTRTMLTLEEATFKLIWREEYSDGTMAQWTFRYELNAAGNRISLSPKATDFGTGDRRAVRPVGDVQFDSSTYYPGNKVMVNAWGTSIGSASITDVTFWGSTKSGIGSTATDENGKEYIVTEENNSYLTGKVQLYLEDDGAFVTQLSTEAGNSYTAAFQANLKKKDGVKNMKTDMVTEYFRYSFSIWYDTETFPEDGFVLYMTAPNQLNTEGKHGFSGQAMFRIASVDGVPYLIIPTARYGQMYDADGKETLDLNAASPDALVKAAKDNAALLDVLQNKVINNYRASSNNGMPSCSIGGTDYYGTRGLYDQLIPLAYQALSEAVTVELEEGWNTIELEFKYLGERTSNDLRKADEGTYTIPTVNGVEGEEAAYQYAVVNSVLHAYFKTNIKVNGEYATYNDDPDDAHNMDFIFDNSFNPCTKEAWMQGQAKLTSNGTETETQQERLKLKDFKLEFLTDQEIDVNCYEKGTDGAEMVRVSAFDGKTKDPEVKASGDVSFVNRNDKLVVTHNTDGSVAEVYYALNDVLVDDKVAFDLSLYTDYVDYTGNLTVAEALRMQTPSSMVIYVGDKIVCSVSADGRVLDAGGNAVTGLKVRGWNDLSVVLEKFEGKEDWYLTLYVQGEIAQFRMACNITAEDMTVFGIRSSGNAGDAYLLDNMAIGLDNIPSSLIYMHPVTYVTGNGQMAYDKSEEYHVIGQENTLFPEIAAEEAVFEQWYFDANFTAKAKRIKPSRTEPVVLYAKYNYRVTYDTQGIQDSNGKDIKTPVPVTLYGNLTLPSRTNVVYWYSLEGGAASAVYKKCGDLYTVLGNINFKAADATLAEVIDFILSVRNVEDTIAGGKNYAELSAAVEAANKMLTVILSDSASLETLMTVADPDAWLAALLSACPQQTKAAIEKACIQDALKYAKETLVEAHRILDDKYAAAQEYLREFYDRLANEDLSYAERMASYILLNVTEDAEGKTWRDRIDVTCPGVFDANSDLATHSRTLERAREAAISLIEAYETYLGGTYPTRKAHFEALKKLLSAYEYCSKKADLDLVLSYVPTADDFRYEVLDENKQPTGEYAYTIDTTHLMLDGANTMSGYMARVKAIFDDYNAQAETIAMDIFAAQAAAGAPTWSIYRTAADGTVAGTPQALPAGLDDIRKLLAELYRPEENA